MRTMWRAVCVFMISSFTSSIVWSETVAERLLASYTAIETLSCDFRKDIESPAGNVRRLSRIFFQRPDHLHVDNVSPVKRRIVADGTALYSYIEGDPRGFSRPVSELDQDWLASLRNIPGTAIEHLVRLAGLPEQELYATEDFPVRRGYQAEKVYVVLNLDGEGRLARIEFFASDLMQQKTAAYAYRSLEQVTPGVWIAKLIEADVWMNGQKMTEVSRLTNLSVNQPLAASLFNPEVYFKDIEFVRDMKDVYK